MLSIPQALTRIKGNLPEPIVYALCRDLQHTFRQRLLTPLVTAHLFLRQVLEGNTAIAERHSSAAGRAEETPCRE